jgi:hypothetical protein
LQCIDNPLFPAVTTNHLPVGLFPFFTDSAPAATDNSTHETDRNACKPACLLSRSEPAQEFPPEVSRGGEKVPSGGPAARPDVHEPEDLRADVQSGCVTMNV